MDSIKDMLHRYQPSQPEEVVAIKKYIYDVLHAESSITLRGNSVVITVHSAALANTLRFHQLELRKLLPEDKRISFRIG